MSSIITHTHDVSEGGGVSRHSNRERYISVYEG